MWVRFVTGRRLQAIHRHHLGVQARDAEREVSLHRGALPQASSVSLAEQLLGRYSSPSQAVVKVELRLRVQETLDGMDPLDREILALRSFEELSNTEAAQVLGIGEAAASHRFVRALRRLKKALAGGAGDPAGDGGHQP